MAKHDGTSRFPEPASAPPRALVHGRDWRIAKLDLQRHVRNSAPAKPSDHRRRMMPPHIVPQQYLRGFETHEGSGLVWVFDKNEGTWSETALPIAQAVDG